MTRSDTKWRAVFMLGSAFHFISVNCVCFSSFNDNDVHHIVEIATFSTIFLFHCCRILIGLNLFHFFLCQENNIMTQVSHSIIIFASTIPSPEKKLQAKKNLYLSNHYRLSFYFMKLWNIDHIINLNTRFFYSWSVFSNLCLIAQSLLSFFHVFRNFILLKFSKWMLSFWYRNKKNVIQYLLVAKSQQQQWSCKMERQKIKLTSTRHKALMLEKKMNE